MPIKYCPIDGGNFGDDLNNLLQPRLFPDLARLHHKILVFGIGTLLDGHHATASKMVVLGSGLGEDRAALPRQGWEFRWVRGPLTAKAFGLPAEQGLGDSALLWPDLRRECAPPPLGPIGLIPHYRTWDSYDWVQVAAQAGMVAINPRQSPTDVITQLRSCSRVMAESLHGAICADAMGIPWAPCILAHRFNAFKWCDWMATVNRDFSPLVTDRPLVRSIPAAKAVAVANRIARCARYKAQSRFPELRPVAPSNAADVCAVADALRAYARNDAHFLCSSARDVAAQRTRMITACRSFAHDYRLKFTL